MVVTPDKSVFILLHGLQERIELGHADQKIINDEINNLKDQVRSKQIEIRDINSTISPIAKAKSDLMWAHGIKDPKARSKAIEDAVSNIKGLISYFDARRGG